MLLFRQEGGNDDQYSLKWNNFQNNLATGFHDLLQEEMMLDVTLAMEGKYLQAHKIVLSVCSPYFKDLFKVSCIFWSGHFDNKMADGLGRWRLWGGADGSMQVLTFPFLFPA